MGNSHETSADVRLIASDNSWIEGDAVRQLNTTADLPGIEYAVGFPDLHPGKAYPVGAAFVSRDCLYPLLAGNDIGCAMAFWRTDMPVRKAKLERWAKKLGGLDMPFDGDTGAWLEQHGLKPGPHDAGLGTIGGGNHFAELQRVEEVFDAERFAEIGLDKGECCLLVHSGSRGLGQAVHRHHIETHGARPLETGSEAAGIYANAHDEACQWAKSNRGLIAQRFADQIGFDLSLVGDVPHNLLSREGWRGDQAWIHRKGAATARGGPVMVPGSRGTLSYLVDAAGDGDEVAWSLAHGAGRRWQRGYAKSRLSAKYRVKDMERTPLGGHVVCEDRQLLYDEAPQAYKDIAQVIDDLTAAGAVKVIASFRPLLTYKCRKQHDD
mgnify:CR=1 FL=1